jgi:hypothetical protein
MAYAFGFFSCNVFSAMFWQFENLLYLCANSTRRASLQCLNRRVVLFYSGNMKTSYTKVCVLPQDLLPLLKSRGLSIADEQKTTSYLANIGYFRLSACLSVD